MTASEFILVREGPTSEPISRQHSYGSIGASADNQASQVALLSGSTIRLNSPKIRHFSTKPISDVPVEPPPRLHLNESLSLVHLHIINIF